ncbi:hypothetical protein [Amycolatopsis pigmentata]|uniref:Uncharacterized protein n=1 Tax=Amycolatopsis pigmentata TaxID=450801 RepID=A0ABW5G326_9PSEU
MARRTVTPHYHGHLARNWTPAAQTGASTFRKALDGEEAVADWLAEQLREAIGKPDLELADEREVWTNLVRDDQTITTGPQGGPTITAVAMTDQSCDCPRPQIRAIPGRHSTL